MIYDEFHRIQNDPKNGGYLPESELRALSYRTGTPLFRLQELASFYPHFRLSPPAKVEVHVCRDMSCHLRGAGRVLQELHSLADREGPERLAVHGVSCLGRCDRGPAAYLNETFISEHSIENVTQLVGQALRGEELPTGCDPPLACPERDQWLIDPYAGQPTYEAIREFLANPDTPRILKEIETAELLGMGGAGRPAHEKWTDVWRASSDDGQKYIVCNGDESEPGTFKDRELLLHKPHLVVEGVILAGLALKATRGYIFIRHEYPEQIAAVRRAILDAEAQGACGHASEGRAEFLLEVFVSPGGYICGEQGALIEALQGNRGQPRNRPPQLETNGLWDKPTLLSNVETFAWAPVIALRGGAWYRDQGINGGKGLRFFSISGDVKRPGVYEVPIGLPLGELLNRLAGGTIDGQPPLAIAPSGPSGGFVPMQIPIEGKRVPDSMRPTIPPEATHFNILDLPLDLGLFRQFEVMLGAGIVVYGQGRDMLDQALNCSEFFRNETCGKCVPCRLGSNKIVEIAKKLVASPQSAEVGSTREMVGELAHAMEMTSICGLGVSAPNPLRSWLRYFQRGSVDESATTPGEGRQTASSQKKGGSNNG